MLNRETLSVLNQNFTFSCNKSKHTQLKFFSKQITNWVRSKPPNRVRNEVAAVVDRNWDSGGEGLRLSFRALCEQILFQTWSRTWFTKFKPIVCYDLKGMGFREVGREARKYQPETAEKTVATATVWTRVKAFSIFIHKQRGRGFTNFYKRVLRRRDRAWAKALGC